MMHIKPQLLFLLLFVFITSLSCASPGKRVSFPTFEELPMGYGIFEGDLNLTILEDTEGHVELMPTPTLGIWATGDGTLRWRRPDNIIEKLHFSSAKVLQLKVQGFGMKPCFTYRNNTYLMLADFLLSKPNRIYIGRVIQIAECGEYRYCLQTHPAKISCELECRLHFLRGGLKRGVSVDECIHSMCDK